MLARKQGRGEGVEVSGGERSWGGEETEVIEQS